MRIRGSKRLILLLLSETILFALMQQITVLAGSRVGGASEPPLVLLSPLQITESDAGSQVTISADQSVNAYSIRQIGSRFELRIRNASASRVQRSFQGAGFAGGRAIQSGADVVLLFHLKPGVKASVVPGVKRLEVNFSGRARPANASRALAKPENLNPTPRVTDNPALPPASRFDFAAMTIAPVPSLSDDALLKPVLVVISDESPPPLPRIVRNAPLPPLSLSRLNLAATTLAPELQFVNALTPTSVPLVEETEPPPEPIAKNPPTSSPPRLGLVAKAEVTMPTVAGDAAPLLPTVSLADKPPSPPQPTKQASENPVTEESSGAPSAAPKASDRSAQETGPADSATADVPTVTDTETAAPVDPTKPAPAQINLPKGPLPGPRRRAPLSQERWFELSGVVSIDYAKTNQTTTLETTGLGDEMKDRGHNFGIGLDLHLGTYLIDPRFLKLSFDSGFNTNRGAFDELATHQGIKGAGLSVDFLPTSPYPFRFHFTRQNTHYLEQQISSASTGRRSLGFEWSLRKPKLPNLSASFEDTSWESRFAASSSFVSQSKTLSIGLTDNVKGWDINSNFSKQSATEGISDLKTDFDFLRFDARRQLSPKSNIFVNSFFEQLHFDNPRTRLGQDFSFFDVRTDFSLQQTKKLSFRASHQFYYSGNDRAVTANDLFQEAAQAARPKSVTSFNAAQGQVEYRLWPSLLIGGTATARFFNMPETQVESASRYLDFTANISWNKRIGFAETRASFVQGLEHVLSNFGEANRVPFNTYSAGVTMGSLRRAQVTADFSSSSRPDLFQIGGFFSQRYYDVSVETEAISRFHIRASAGQNELHYLTAGGREHLKTTTYSLSIDDKWFTALLNHNSNRGVRDVFLFPITGDHTRIFRVLPLDVLVRDPLLDGSGVFTLGLVRFKPRHGLEVEIRYLNDKVLFARTNDVFSKQFDILARYKMGQITLTSGLIFSQQDTEGLFRRHRNYFFVRLLRPFTLF